MMLLSIRLSSHRRLLSGTAKRGRPLRRASVACWYAEFFAVDAQVAYRVAGIHVEEASVDSRIGAAPLCERRDFGEGAVADEGQTAMRPCRYLDDKEVLCRAKQRTFAEVIPFQVEPFHGVNTPLGPSYAHGVHTVVYLCRRRQPKPCNKQYGKYQSFRGHFVLFFLPFFGFIPSNSSQRSKSLVSLRPMPCL